MYEVLIASGHYKYLLEGLKITLTVTFFALIIGFLLGLAIAILRKIHEDTSRFGILNRIAKIYVTVIRGTPTTLQLLMMFNLILVGLSNTVIVAIVTFGLNSSAYMSEIFRGGLLSTDPGEVEAARSLGLTYGQSLYHIVLPRAFRNALPALGNEVITLFKETSISGFIGLMDLTRAGDIVMSLTYQATIPYVAAALIYLTCVLLLEKLFRMLEERTRHA